MVNNIISKNEYSKEAIGAIFVIVFVSMFILSNFMIGFSLPIYLAAMIPATIMSIIYPRSGFLAIIFLTFIFERFFTLTPILIGITEVKLYPVDVIMLAVILGIAIYFLKRKIKIDLRLIDIILFTFIALAITYGVFSVFILGNDTALSFSSAKNYGIYALMYFIAHILIRSKEDFKIFAQFILTGGIIIVGFLIFGVLRGEGLWSEYTPLSTEGIRILAFTHGYYLSMLFIFAFTYIFSHKNDNLFAKILIILMPIWGIGIIGSMMRHLWVSLFIALMIVTIFLAKNLIHNSKKVLIKYIIVIFISTITIFYLSSLMPRSQLNIVISDSIEVIGSRVSSIGNSSDESVFWRSVAWKEALKEYSFNPILGVGFGKFISVEIGSYKEFVEIRNIHNSFLVLLVQMGILGMTFFISPVIILLKRSIFKLWEHDDGLHMARIASIGILILHLVAFIFQPYLETNLLGIFFWINLGIMRSLFYKENYENIRNK